MGRKFSIMWSQWLEKAEAPGLARAVQSLREPGPSCRVIRIPLSGGLLGPLPQTREPRPL